MESKTDDPAPSQTLLPQQEHLLHPYPGSPQTYLQAATSNNTRKAYQQDIRHFIAWGGLLPTTPEAVIQYLHHYAPTLNPRTLLRRMTALKHWHTYQGFSDPTAHPLVRKTLIGIQKVHGQPKDKAPALPMELLTQVIQKLSNSNRLIDLRNSALLQIGFFGAFRRSELVAIQYEHLSFVAEGVEILIPRSKTDQTGSGHTCAIPYGELPLCPPSALKIWCEQARIQAGPVFRRVNKKDSVLASGLNSNYLSQLLKRLASEHGLPDAKSYSSHSLRRGFATTAGQQNVSLSAIMHQGRWRHSDTALGYIEEGKRFENNAACVLLKQGKTQVNLD